MGKRSPQSVQKRAREQAMREKLKQAKKDARAADRRDAGDPLAETDARPDAE